MRLLTSFLAYVALAAAPIAIAGPASAPPASLEPVLGALTTDKLFKTADVAVQVVELGSGEEVFAWQADKGMTPASTMKVLTAATALKHLGPAYRFRTTVYMDGEVDAAGVLKGDLYVKGTGDPHFVVERMWKLVQDVKLAGVEKIEGNVIFDESAFEPDYAIAGWNKKEDIERGPAYFPSIGALSVNFNTAAVVVGPGKTVGEPAKVQLETSASKYVEIVNQVTTGSERARRVVEVEREVIEEGKKLKLTVTGTVPIASRPTKYYRSIPEPTAHFMAAWHDMMKSQGLGYSGTLRRGVVPRTADELAEHVSPPLSVILMDMNKFSNNFMAEQVFRTVGGAVKGGPASTAKGAEVVGEYLQGIGVDPAEFRLVNGSGLSRDISLQPSVLTAVLVDMAADGKVGQEFLSSLAIAGLDGTLSRRLTDDPGRMRGKTGTIDGVHCLTGYLDSTNGSRYAFAFMVNDLSGSSSQVKRVHDRFAREVLGLADQDAVVEEEEEE